MEACGWSTYYQPSPEAGDSQALPWFVAPLDPGEGRETAMPGTQHKSVPPSCKPLHEQKLSAKWLYLEQGISISFGTSGSGTRDFS